MTLSSRIREPALRSQNVLDVALSGLGQALLVVGPRLEIGCATEGFRRLFALPFDVGQAETSSEALHRYLAESGEYGAGSVPDHIEARQGVLRRREDYAMTRVRPCGRHLHITGRATQSGNYVFLFRDVTPRALMPPVFRPVRR